MGRSYVAPIPTVADILRDEIGVARYDSTLRAAQQAVEPSGGPIPQARGEGTLTGPTFSEWLAARSRQHGWPVREVARRAGVDPATVSRIISGHNQPTRSTVERIGGAFGEVECALRVGGFTDSLVSDSISGLGAGFQVRMLDFVRWLAELGIFGSPASSDRDRWLSALEGIVNQVSEQLESPHRGTDGLGPAPQVKLEPPADFVGAGQWLRESISAMADCAPVFWIEDAAFSNRDILDALRACQLLRGPGSHRYKLGVAPPLLPIALLSLTEKLPWRALTVQIPSEIPYESSNHVTQASQLALRRLHERFETQLSAWERHSTWDFAKTLSATLWEGLGWQLSVGSDTTKFATEAKVVFGPPTTEIFYFSTFSTLVLPEERFGGLLPEVLGGDLNRLKGTRLWPYWRAKSYSRLGYYENGIAHGCAAGTRLHYQLNYPALVAHIRTILTELTSNERERYVDCMRDVFASAFRIKNLEIRTADFSSSEHPLGSIRRWLGACSQRFTLLGLRDVQTKQVSGFLMNTDLAAQSLGKTFSSLMQPEGLLALARDLNEEGEVMKASDEELDEAPAMTRASEVIRAIVD